MNSLKDYNIILVTLDGFRKDKISFCPSLQSFIEKSIFFPKMVTISPYTFAAHHAIFSGMCPSRNGVDAYYHILDFKKDEIVTLPQLLKRAGYYTSSDTLDDSVLPRQGFDEYNIFDEKTTNLKERHRDFIHRLAKKEKFFLFLHFTDTHKNYVRIIVEKQKQQGSDSDDEYFRSKKQNNDRYNSCLLSCDEYVSTLINSLKDAGISDKTILIFISDHGTSIGEKKGEKFYGVFVYEYTINVFCIMNIPGNSPQVIKKQCSTLDLFPTILEIAGIPNGEKGQLVQGESLFSLIENASAKDREVFVETGGLYGPWPSPEKHNVFCVKINNKKLIYNDTPQTWEFYNLETDPEELHNIFDESLEEVKYLKKRLLHYLKENLIDVKITPR